MRTFFAVTLLMALGLVFPSLAADKQDLDHFESRVQQLNSLAEKPGMMKVAIQTISNETGVPVEKVRNQHKRHSDMGIAGLMIANVLADDTKKAPEHFLSERESGKKWVTIARENKVSVDKLNERLDRFARALKGGK
jgi:hypothetical protein